MKYKNSKNDRKYALETALQVKNVLKSETIRETGAKSIDQSLNQRPFSLTRAVEPVDVAHASMQVGKRPFWF